MSATLHDSLPPGIATTSLRALGLAGPPGLFDIAEETPIAIAYAGIPYAVMMATPSDIEDFALGFSLSEGIIATASDIRAIRILPGDDAVQADITLTPAALQRFLKAHRHRALRTHTSCGLCGIEAPDQLPAITRQTPTPPSLPAAAIRRAVAQIRDFQPLSIRTRSAHAAAWVGLDGNIAFAREDVGRHNALDKLIGACLRAGTGRTEGFCLITSRCSFEMVQKAAAAGFRALVAIAAPTARAVRAAETAGLLLVVHAGHQPQLCLPSSV